MKRHRTILLVDNDEFAKSVMKVVLTTNGYHVRGAAYQDAVPSLLMGGIDLALIALETGTDDQSSGFLTEEVKRLAPEVKVALFSRKRRWASEHQADIFLPKDTPTSELLQNLKLLLIRKRGPKRHVPARTGNPLPQSQTPA